MIESATQTNVYINLESANSIFAFPAKSLSTQKLKLPEDNFTSIKVNDISCLWIGKGSKFAYDFRSFFRNLRELEAAMNAENISNDRLATIKQSEELVSEASSSYSHMQIFGTKLSTLLNGLMLSEQPHTEATASQIEQLQALQSKHAELKLPKKLTPEAVNKYKEDVQQLLSELKTKLEALNIPTTDHRPDVSETQKTALFVIRANTEHETLHLAIRHANDCLENLLEKIEVAESKLSRHSHLAAELKIIKDRREVSHLRKQSPSMPYIKDQVTQYCTAVDALCKTLHTAIDALYVQSRQLIADQLKAEKERVAAEKAAAEKAAAEKAAAEKTAAEKSAIEKVVEDAKVG